MASKPGPLMKTAAVFSILGAMAAIIMIPEVRNFAGLDNQITPSPSPPPATTSPPVSPSPSRPPDNRVDPIPQQSPSPSPSASPTTSVPTSTDPCGQKLRQRMGEYRGRAIVQNSSKKLSGAMRIVIQQYENGSCDIIADFEDFPPLGGQGNLYGRFEAQEIQLQGTLSHQSKPKVWDVDMTIKFLRNNEISGNSTWKPKTGVTDQKIYYESFTATKSL